MVEGIIYRYRAGIPWRDLPEEFGPYQTVWKRQARWSKDGTWDRLLTRLQTEADADGDSTVVRVHQSGAIAARSVARLSSHTRGSAESQGSAPA